MNNPNDFETHDENPYQSDGQEVKKQKSWFGCCIFGCLGMFVLMVLVIGGSIGAGYWWVAGQVDKYTSDTAADIPTVEMSEEELAEIQGRVDNFKASIEGADDPEDLVLTADELNALIAQNEDLHGRVYLRIEDEKISGDISIPADFFPGGKGRFFNASATFEVSLDRGVLVVTLTDAEVKGEALPSKFIDTMRGQNLAKDAYDDPQVAETLRHIESITIEGDKMILKPRDDADETPTPTIDSIDSSATEVSDDPTETAGPASDVPNATAIEQE